MVSLREELAGWLQSFVESPELADLLSQMILGLLVLILSFFANLVARKVILGVLQRMIRRTRTGWDDVLLEHGFFHRLSHLAPALVIYTSAFLFPGLEELISNVALAYMGLIGLLVTAAFLDASRSIYQTYEAARTRPIKGFIQAIKVFVFLVGGIAILGALLDESPWKLISGIGALTAIVLLVFKDSILGFVAGIQISANDMVAIGDWIEMPKYGADGDVIDITLQCVKVRNWDQTITMIPTYALVSDSFKNWRGMTEAGGRRIKRALFIDMNSVKFCSDEMLERFLTFEVLAPYLKDRLEEVETHNQARGLDASHGVNARRLTNIGTFRAYIQGYLRSHPHVRPDMTLLVRHLPPSGKGLPIEIYLFCDDIRWASYESIQADIFDHLLAVLPEFELRVYQSPSGLDLLDAVASVRKNPD